MKKNRSKRFKSKVTIMVFMVFITIFIAMISVNLLSVPIALFAALSIAFLIAAAMWLGAMVENENEETYFIIDSFEEGAEIIFKWSENDLNIKMAQPCVVYTVIDSRYEYVLCSFFLNDFADRIPPVPGVKYVKQDGRFRKK